MKDICKYIKESLYNSPWKGMKILFHGTTFERFENILNDNVLKGRTWEYRIPNGSKYLHNFSNTNINDLSDDDYVNYLNDKASKRLLGISLTRNFELNFENSEVKFVLNWKLLKQKYGKKLQPIDYFGNNDNYKEIYTNDNDDREIDKHLGKADPTRPIYSKEYEEFLNINKLDNLNKYIVGFILLKNNDNIIQEIINYCNKYKLQNIPITDNEGKIIETIK